MARNFNKIQSLINKLPNNPDKKIIWIVYNSDMGVYVENLIESIKGKSYLDKYVVVTPKSESYKYEGKIYFDPYFYDHLGNGNT